VAITFASGTDLRTSALGRLRMGRDTELEFSLVPEQREMVGMELAAKACN
jgi:hypothetical protein